MKPKLEPKPLSVKPKSEPKPLSIKPKLEPKPLSIKPKFEPNLLSVKPPSLSPSPSDEAQTSPSPFQSSPKLSSIPSM